jgi:hypothetical protein
MLTVPQKLISGVLGRTSSPYTAAANALFAAMTTPPTTARKIIINNLIVALQNAGAWSRMDCLYVLAAADSQAARLNWKTPGTLTASAVNSPAFAADQGYTGDGSTSLLDSGFNPATAGGQFALNSAHLGLWDRLDIGTTGNPQVGNLNATLQNKSAAAGSTLCRVNAGSSITSTGIPTGVLSHYVGNRNNSSTHDIWAAGNKVASAVASTSTSVSSLTFAMLGRQIGASSYQYSPRQMSAFHWGADLSDAQITATYNALLTYMQAVGAA